MCNKYDMANAVIKHCDEDHGIVFNKKPSKNENKFSIIYDYSVSSISKNSNISNSLHSLERITNNKSFKIFDNMSHPKCYYKSSLENLKKNKEQKNDNKYSDETKTEEVKKKNKTTEIFNDTYEVIAPEGRGKFIKFIGENYVYVMLENGTYNCYPVELLKLNCSYLKKNKIYNLCYNYKDIALRHTRNVLKLKNNSLDKNEDILNKEKKSSDDFLHFPEEMDYLRYYIIKNDIEDENASENEYLTHTIVKKMKPKDNENDKNYLHDPIIPIKKNVTIKKMNNEYKIEKTSSYIPVDYINFDNENCNTCC
ncbi:conserved Plasmodium protein, unknown function [Plasmodium gallinaceum]|uniref:Uncharacterized protein n=1 Tax=Plasmodium gallinaceum TaxID=5849 RepID=A0A1J1GTL5_PLAGA|nr:conserved Plasmodium protein, unknown function [Plasmodium gallinaceum]CRG95852.1 conserved Plasmodium protein, unknown function [Plasmodium gallinaceum]